MNIEVGRHTGKRRKLFYNIQYDFIFMSLGKSKELSPMKNLLKNR